MSESRSKLESVMDKLQQERDELRVQLHLASMDAKDEYERLSGRFDELRTQVEPLTSAVGETADNVFSALGMAAEELWHGFGRVRKSMKSEDEE